MASQLLGIKTRFTNDLGSPLVGGQVYTYFAGTSTNQDSYSDAALTVPNTNPVILDDTGSADIFLKGSYRIRVFDKLGRFIEEQDNVTQAASQGDATELTNKVNAVESGLSTANTEINKVKLDTGITATAKLGGVERAQSEKNADVVSVKDFGAKGDNVTDDWQAIQNAIDSTSQGYTVYLPYGKYVISRPLTLKKGVTLKGNWAPWWVGRIGPVQNYIKPLFGGFTGDCLISMELSDTSTGVFNGSDALGAPRLYGITLSGNRAKNTLGEAIHGVVVQDDVHDVQLEKVTISTMTGHGYHSKRNNGQKLDKVVCYNNSKAGFYWGEDIVNGAGCIDIAVNNCLAQINNEGGFVINNPNASVFTSCRAEFNANEGFKIRGKVYNLMMGFCNTDRNQGNGFDQRTTGRAVLYNTCLAKRDASKVTGGAGFLITKPSTEKGGGAYLNNCGATIAANDDGTGTVTPSYGVDIGDVEVVGIAGGYYAGTITAIRDPKFIADRTGSVRTFVGNTEQKNKEMRMTSLANASASLNFYKQDVNIRWSMGMSSSSGGDWYLQRFDNDGATLSYPITVTRANGLITLGDYPSTRNDAQQYTPTNYLYTTDSGVLRTAPIWIAAPASSSSSGKKGQKAYDSGYFYICIDDNNWRRVQLAAF